MDLLTILLSIFTDYGYVAVFCVLLLCGFGIPIPEDISLVAGGIIAGLGYANVHWMFGVGLAGVLIGDATMFCIGRFYGDQLRCHRWVAWLLTPERYAGVQDKFTRYGSRLMFVARFLPGMRSAIYLTAGATRRVGFFRFILLDGLAALISVPVWVYLGYYGAYNREWLMTWVGRGQVGILSILGLLMIGLVIAHFVRKRRAAVRSSDQ